MSRRPEVLEDRAAASVGDPAALGLCGFAAGTWVVGPVVAGRFPEPGLIGTIPVLRIFAGVAQFIAGLIAFRCAKVLSGAAFKGG